MFLVIKTLFQTYFFIHLKIKVFGLKSKDYITQCRNCVTAKGLT